MPLGHLGRHRPAFLSGIGIGEHQRGLESLGFKVRHCEAKFDRAGGVGTQFFAGFGRLGYDLIPDRYAVFIEQDHSEAAQAFLRSVGAVPDRHAVDGHHVLQVHFPPRTAGGLGVGG